MVGVPRSQGCRNCRRKKKGCDLQKPVCGQCARLNITCGWDEKKWTFVSQEPATAGPSNIPIRSRSADALETSLSSTLPTGLQERSLARTAFEIDLQAELWVRFLPKDDIDTVYIGGIYTTPWVRTLQDIATFDTTTRVALNALATTIIGRARSDSTLLQESTRLYAQALRETNRALQDSKKAQSDAVLACCKILAMYENFRVDRTSGVSTQGLDWHKHVEGTCRIVELRGPAKHVSDHGHNLFEDARLLAVIAGMTLRKPNFFTNLAWHTIPWETWPRNLHDNLCDIMIALPDLLQSQDRLLQMLAHSGTNRERFAIITEGQNHINRCIRIGESLREWEQDVLLACLKTSSIDTHNYAGPITLLEVYEDHGYGFFNVAMEYWVTSLVLYATTWVTYRSIMLAARPDQPPSLPAWMRLPDIPEWMNPRLVASNIVKGAPHYFVDDAGFWGASAAAFPLGAAMHYYAATGGQDSEEIGQLHRVLGETKLGVVTSEFLRSIANTAESARGDPAKREDHKRMATSWYGMDTIHERRQQMS